MSMLPGAPWLLAHKSMLAVNQPRKISLYGCDYVLWQDQTGRVNALPNTCPHLGAMLSEGWCQPSDEHSSAIVCPFHALAFDHEGCTVLPGSNQKTLPLLNPLELIIQGDLIWSYGRYEPKIPIPTIVNEIAAKYEFIGHTGDTSVETDLLTAPTTWREKLRNPNLFLLPDVIKAHLENHFPSLVIFHGETGLGKIAQCHLFVPESPRRTRTYILLYGLAKSPAFKLLRQSFLNFAKVVVEQDADILHKIYPNTPQQINLNNEVGMDWVRRNFASFPEIVEPNFSKLIELS